MSKEAKTANELLVDEHKYNIYGVILEAINMRRAGGALALWQENVQSRVDQWLLKLVEEAQKQRAIFKTGGTKP